jgi:hypothetical protein
MCYYKVQMNNATLDTQNYTYGVQLLFNTATSVSIQINNGTQMAYASNAQTVDLSSNNVFTYNVSHGQIVYILV